MNRLHHLSLCLLFVALATSCGGDERCAVPIGITNFQIEPNAAYYSGLNVVGGYIYLTGGHRGVVVVRTGIDQFKAYERSCPADTNTAVVVSGDWGSSLLECPKCHTCFIVDAEGVPMDGGATHCPLYQYSTSYTGGVLYVF